MYLEFAFLIAGYGIGSLVTAAVIFSKHLKLDEEWHGQSSSEIWEYRAAIEMVFHVHSDSEGAQHSSVRRLHRPANDSSVTLSHDV